MKSLPTLVRLHKWNVDQQRRYLSKLLAKQHDLENLQTELEQSVETEQRLADSMTSGGQIYAAYAQSVLLARDKLEDEIAELQDELKQAQEAVAASFRKLKKYQVIEEEERLKAQLEMKKRDQAILDEVAGVHAARDET